MQELSRLVDDGVLTYPYSTRGVCLCPCLTRRLVCWRVCVHGRISSCECVCDPPTPSSPLRAKVCVCSVFAELVNIVRHLQQFPGDPVPAVLRNVLAFDQVRVYGCADACAGACVSSDISACARVTCVRNNVCCTRCVRDCVSCGGAMCAPPPQMDGFAMASVREVLTKRGLSIDYSPSLAAPHITTHTAKLIQGPWVPLAMLPGGPEWELQHTTSLLRNTSVGYLLSSAVKSLRAVGIHDGRIHGWSPEGRVWQLPELHLQTLGESPRGGGAAHKPLTVVGGASGVGSLTHILAK